MNRAGRPALAAYSSACHSGENSAYGQNAARPCCSGACARTATGGVSSVTCPTSASASGGPSISTMSGASAVSAARTARAEPGP